MTSQFKHFHRAKEYVWVTNEIKAFCRCMFVKMLLNTTMITGGKRESVVKDKKVE